MNRRWTFIVILAVAALSVGIRTVWGDQAETSQNEGSDIKTRQHFNKLRRTSENIYKITMRTGVVYRLQTALGYVSTIDLPEKALKVFVGDQELFKVEVYEKQVLIKPITDEADAKSNLVIVTDSGRLAFDVSVGPPSSADFVLDFRLPQDDSMLVRNAFEEKVQEKAKQLENKYQEKEKQLNDKATKMADEKLKEDISSAVKSIPLKASQVVDGLQVNLLSLSQVGDKAYLRFSILNYSKNSYRVLKGMVGAITEERKFLKKKETGFVEFPSDLKIQDVIQPDSYVYGLLSFEYKVLGKKEKPVFRLLDDGGTRNIEMKDFKWFE
jgi:type IV secretory pathway VirB9-like protein